MGFLHVLHKGFSDCSVLLERLLLLNPARGRLPAFREYGSTIVNRKRVIVAIPGLEPSNTGYQVQVSKLGIAAFAIGGRWTDLQVKKLSLALPHAQIAPKHHPLSATETHGNTVHHSKTRKLPLMLLGI